jgi:leukotriene-A4 hydrolase
MVSGRDAPNVGGVEVFNPYQKAYIQAFEGKSLTTQQWEEHFW